MLYVGDVAPDFELPNQNDQPTRLSDFRGQRVVMFAFPMAGTPGCTSQACSFRDAFPQVEAQNAVILGISPDFTSSLRLWKRRQRLPYTLLSDADHDVLTAFGAWGIGDGIFQIPSVKRSYWVIDEHGVVVAMKIGVSPDNSVTEALAALNALTTTP
ncbi:MAG: peroxiredoxin [Phototrophicaceae bacterium]|jgi:peroxiredoxin Q/BCP